MRPKSNGSSTIGMKKSVVAISACSSLRRYTAASSAVSMPTISSGGSGMRAVPLRISDSTPGAILQPQPPPCESEVRRGSPAGTEGVTGVFMLLRQQRQRELARVERLQVFQLFAHADEVHGDGPFPRDRG